MTDKLVGGEPAKDRNVLTWSRNGVVVGALVVGAAGGYMCCQPIPPNGPPTPIPTATVDAKPPEIDAPNEPDVAAAQCEFVGPRARGGKRRETRVVGGKPAETGAFPFAAALASSSGFQYCGASVIGERFALTAAHCQVEAGDRVLVGSTDLVQMRQLTVVESRIHPRFDSQTMDYDVAIAVLGADANVPAVTLAAGVTSLDATVIGWGKTCEGCPTTQHLREVSIPLWEGDSCRNLIGDLTSRQVCAGLVQGGKDSCQGDSGGSLLTWNVDHWEQLGIVSWGIGCARPNAPGVYTDLRATELREWIASCSK